MTNHGTYKTYTYLTYKTLLSVVLYFTYDHPECHGANAQNTYRRIRKSYCSRPIHAKIISGLSRQRLKAMKALNALYAKYANVLVEKRTLVVKSKI